MTNQPMTLKPASPQDDESQARRLLVWVTSVTLIIGLVWAWMISMDEITHVEGKIILSTRVQVIQAGQPILEIVPTEDEMMVEAYVKPSEVAFLKVGQKAVVKLSAYDFNKYGGLDGELEHLSPDTMKDDRQQRRPGANPADMEEGYYRILVRIKDTNLVRNGKKMQPTPGMTATVEIRTGQKTVLEYLFRPLQNVTQALRER